MKKLCVVLSLCLLGGGCSLEDLGFTYSTGTGLEITKEVYDSINVGDSYSEIKKLVGGDCENYYSSDDEDWYRCVDDKDSSKKIVLKFENNKLTHKSSSGLN